MGDDEVLAALDGLVAALELNSAQIARIGERAAALRSARLEGRGYRDIVTAEHRPLIVEMLRANLDRLNTAGSRFRRAEAAALRAEGMTYDEIAALFGVTRQRVIALVREHKTA
jgi:hypothetical protein